MTLAQSGFFYGRVVLHRVQCENSALCPEMGTRVSICTWLVLEVEHFITHSLLHIVYYTSHDWWRPELRLFLHLINLMKGQSDFFLWKGNHDYCGNLLIISQTCWPVKLKSSVLLASKIWKSSALLASKIWKSLALLASKIWKSLALLASKFAEGLVILFVH